MAKCGQWFVAPRGGLPSSTIIKLLKGRREYDGLLPDLGSIAEKRGGPFPLHTLLSSTKPVPSLAPASEEVVSWFLPLFLSD